MKTKLRFRSHWGPYKPGETREFAKAHAERLVSAGVAELLTVDRPVIAQPVEPPRQADADEVGRRVRAEAEARAAKARIAELEATLADVYAKQAEAPQPVAEVETVSTSSDGGTSIAEALAVVDQQRQAELLAEEQRLREQADELEREVAAANARVQELEHVLAERQAAAAAQEADPVVEEVGRGETILAEPEAAWRSKPTVKMDIPSSLKGKLLGASFKTAGAVADGLADGSVDAIPGIGPASLSDLRTHLEALAVTS